MCGDGEMVGFRGEGRDWDRTASESPALGAGGFQEHLTREVAAEMETSERGPGKLGVCALPSQGVLGVHKASSVHALMGDVEVEGTCTLRDGEFPGLAAEFMPVSTGSAAWECFWGEACVGVCARTCVGS